MFLKAFKNKYMGVGVCMLVTQSFPTLCDPMVCGPPGSSVHGILQARILEWITIPYSRGIFPTQESNLGLLHCRRILFNLSHQGSPGMGSKGGDLSEIEYSSIFSPLFTGMLDTSNSDSVFSAKIKWVKECLHSWKVWQEL